MAMVDQSSRGRISVIAFQAPPVNSLGYALRVEMLAALQRAAADPGVAGIVLVGSNGTFSAGADIREFGTPEMNRPYGPSIPCSMISTSRWSPRSKAWRSAAVSSSR